MNLWCPTGNYFASEPSSDRSPAVVHLACCSFDVCDGDRRMRQDHIYTEDFGRISSRRTHEQWHTRDGAAGHGAKRQLEVAPHGQVGALARRRPWETWSKRPPRAVCRARRPSRAASTSAVPKAPFGRSRSGATLPFCECGVRVSALVVRERKFDATAAIYVL